MHLLHIKDKEPCWVCGSRKHVPASGKIVQQAGLLGLSHSKSCHQVDKHPAAARWLTQCISWLGTQPAAEGAWMSADFTQPSRYTACRTELHVPGRWAPPFQELPTISAHSPSQCLSLLGIPDAGPGSCAHTWQQGVPRLGTQHLTLSAQAAATTCCRKAVGFVPAGSSPQSSTLQGCSGLSCSEVATRSTSRTTP